MIYKQYKATFFAELFSQPQRLRELYNALAGTDYGEETPVEINTLENVFFHGLRNDLSFTIDNKHVLVLEHQSTINANMPLRCLMYIARLYEKITDDKAIYHDKLIEIPTPEFIVLYNGVKPFPAEKILNLSDAYKSTDKSAEKFGSLSLTVRVLNINPGYNDELLQKCETLSGYTAFVEHIRSSRLNGANLQDAVKKAITWGMTQDTLRTFLTEHGSEVNSMIAGREFNIDIAKEVWQEEAYEDGREEGLKDIARKLKESALMTSEQIVQITGLSVEDVEKL